MAEGFQEIPKNTWKNFLQKHWKMALVIAAGIACAVVGAIAVFLWRTTGPEALVRYPPTLGLWTVGYLVSLLVDLILWGLLLIVLPIIAAAICIYFLWWKRIPAGERQEYFGGPREKRPRRRARRGSAGGIFNIFVFITWLIIIGADGNWSKAFGLWTFSYLVISVLAAFLWDLLIIAIPVTIAFIWWVRRK
jgi:hypothetical protein